MSPPMSANVPAALALALAATGCQPTVEAQVAPPPPPPPPIETSKPGAVAPVPEPPPSELVVTAAGLRLRAEASTGSEIVLALTEGEEVEVLAVGDVERIAGRTASWHHVQTADGERGWAFGAHLAPSPGGEVVAAATARAVAARRRSWVSTLDSETLPRLLEELGYRPPPTLKALIVSVERQPGGALRFHRFDLRGTSRDRDDWWPASSVKVFAAVAALERLRSLGLSPSARATFHYEDGPVTVEVAQVVRKAVGPSNNQAFDRLVEVVGSRRLNDEFFAKRNGLQDTLLLRSYTHRHRHPESGEGSSRTSPRVTLVEGALRRVLPPAHDAEPYRGRRCAGVDRDNRPRSESGFEGNCTTLADLVEVLRRVVLHDDLPPLERFDLGARELALLRSSLSKRRSRGMNVVDGLVSAFDGRPSHTWSKPGYALNWFSDAVFLRLDDTGEEYLVALANRPGREACDDAARHVGSLLAAGHFRPEGIR